MNNKSYTEWHTKRTMLKTWITPVIFGGTCTQFYSHKFKSMHDIFIKVWDLCIELKKKCVYYGHWKICSKYAPPCCIRAYIRRDQSTLIFNCKRFLFISPRHLVRQTPPDDQAQIYLLRHEKSKQLLRFCRSYGSFSYAHCWCNCVCSVEELLVIQSNAYLLH